MLVFFKKAKALLVLLLFLAFRYASALQAPGLSISDRFNLFNYFITSISPARISISESDRAERVKAKYDQIFSHRELSDFEHPSDDDLHLLFRASSTTAYLTVSREYVNFALVDFENLMNKSIARKDEASDMYGLLIQERMFGQAHKLASNFHDVKFEPVPSIIDERSSGDDAYSVYAISQSAYSVRLKNAKLRNGKEILVIASPLCHFSQDAIADIESNQFTKDAFEKYSLWIAPPMPSFSIQDFQSWNQTHTHSTLAVAVREKDWPMVKDWATPNIYFIDNGKIVYHKFGWSKGKDVDSLTLALENFIKS